MRGLARPGGRGPPGLPSSLPHRPPEPRASRPGPAQPPGTQPTRGHDRRPDGRQDPPCSGCAPRKVRRPGARTPASPTPPGRPPPVRRGAARAGMEKQAARQGTDLWRPPSSPAARRTARTHATSALPPGAPPPAPRLPAPGSRPAASGASTRTRPAVSGFRLPASWDGPAKSECEGAG